MNHPNGEHAMPVKHIAFLEFKAGTSQDTIDRCFSDLRSMVGRIDGLQEMIGGPYDSDEGLNDGYTHGFIMTFDSPDSRDAYLPHPIHEDVKKRVVPNLARFVVFDFNV
jgi:hypothetical protein